MIIYLAGNIPDRVREEKELIKHGVIKRRLYSYYFHKIDITMRQVFLFWKSLC